MKTVFRKMFTNQRQQISLRLKAISFVAGLQIILFLFLAYVLIDNFHEMTERMFQEHFIQMAEVLGSGNKEAFENADRIHLQQEIEQLIGQKDILYVYLHDSTGAVLAGQIDSVASSWDLDQSRMLAIQSPKSIVHRVGPLPGGFFHESGHNLEVAAPIYSSNRRIGTVRLGVTTETYNSELADFSKQVLLLLLVSFGVVGLLLLFVDKRVRITLHRLMNTASAMAKGDLSRRVQVRTGDELESLGETFNAMADALEERDKALMHHQEKLEMRVRERTRELEEERNKLRAIIDNVPSAFLLVDKNRIIQAASQNFRQIGGFGYRNIVGKYCEPGLWQQSFCQECLIEQVFEKGQVIKRERQKIKSDGSVWWIEQITVPIKGSSGVEAVIEILTDITERKSLESQLIRSEKLATTGEMAAVIAHELRNSLTSLKMILQMFYEADRLNNDDRESLGVSLDSIHRMEQVVNDLLQFARPRRIRKEQAQVNDVVKASIDMAKHELDRKGIKTMLHLDESLPPISVDSKFLEEALVNLILNGIQAVDGKGHIELRTSLFRLTEPRTDTFIQNRWETENNQDPNSTEDFSPSKLLTQTLPDTPYHSEPEILQQQSVKLQLGAGMKVIRIEISDNGKGIPESMKKRIFDPFYTTKLNGTGLGLSLVKRIVNEHKGIIDFISKPGEGTKFVILIPVNDLEAKFIKLQD